MNIFMEVRSIYVGPSIQCLLFLVVRTDPQSRPFVVGKKCFFLQSPGALLVLLEAAVDTYPWRRPSSRSPWSAGRRRRSSSPQCSAWREGRREGRCSPRDAVPTSTRGAQDLTEYKKRCPSVAPNPLSLQHEVKENGKSKAKMR